MFCVASATNKLRTFQEEYRHLLDRHGWLRRALSVGMSHYSLSRRSCNNDFEVQGINPLATFKASLRDPAHDARAPRWLTSQPASHPPADLSCETQSSRTRRCALDSRIRKESALCLRCTKAYSVTEDKR